MTEVLPLAVQMLAPLHMGALHSYEKLLVMLLAFGPFLVLAVVVYVLRKRAVAEEEGERGRR